MNLFKKTTPTERTGRIRSYDYYRSVKRKSERKQKSRFSKKPQPKPGKVTKVRGAKYRLPVEGKINELNVNEEKLKSKIQTLMTGGTVSPGFVAYDTSSAPHFQTKTSTQKDSVGNNNTGEEINNSTNPRLNIEIGARDSPVNRKVTSKNSKSSLSLLLDKEIDKNKNLKYVELLNPKKKHIELNKLKKLSWNGIPFENRALVWKVMVGYHTCNRDQHEEIISNRTDEYFAFVSKYCSFEHGDSVMVEFEKKQKFQISIDIPRTHPGIKMFQCKKIQNSLERILYIWAIRHPASGYVQGMNDILSIFFTTFMKDVLKEDDLDKISKDDIEKVDEKTFKQIECDSFWCFSYFIDSIQDHYTFAQPGIKRMIDRLQDVIKKIDSKLHDKIIIENNLHFIQLFFRWMNCLLIRELRIDLVTRIFDTYLAEKNFENLHVFVCAAFLKNWSEELLKLDVTEFIIFVQNLPTKEWTIKEIEMLLSQSYILKRLYQK